MNLIARPGGYILESGSVLNPCNYGSPVGGCHRVCSFNALRVDGRVPFDHGRPERSLAVLLDDKSAIS